MAPGLRPMRAICALVLWLQTGFVAQAAGAFLQKSGPIQITADGAYVWLVNPDHDSVSRLRTSDNDVTVVPLPPTGGPQNPRGLAIHPQNAAVWVAAMDSDRVYVLDGGTGAVQSVINLPYGSAPVSVAFNAAGDRAYVALHRADAVAVIDAASGEISKTITGLFRHPFGLAVSENPAQVWVTHTITDGEDTHVTVLDPAALNVQARLLLKSVNPKDPIQISGDPEPIPEGGYLLIRGHPAVPPNSPHIWLPTQYHNFHNDAFTPDSTMQSAIHRLELATLQAPGANNRVVLTARYAHSNNTLIGDGWDAQVAGPIDLAFSADGSTAYVLHTYSNDVLVVHTSIGMAKPFGAPPLTEISVGDNPIGLVAAPNSDRLYVLNYLSRDVSIIDTTTAQEIERIPATPGQPEPLDPEVLQGARLFNTSVDPRISSNQKVACASCHTDGQSDGLIWDFAQFGAGQRKTLPLRGLALSMEPQENGLGQLHRSGDRDEVQDFEFTFREVMMGGSGFLPSPNPALGDPNAGLDPDLDALAAYLLSLPPVARSPHRASDGSLTPAAERGAALFRLDSGPLAVGCVQCHSGSAFTDLGFHDVDGFTQGVEHEGPAFNTPTLVGAWDTGPFVQAVGHVTDAQTLGGVVRNASGQHGDATGLSRTLQRDLEAFLNSLDGELFEQGIDQIHDTLPPRVIAVQPIRPDRVLVIFDEAIDPATAEDPAHYAFVGPAGTIVATSAELDAAWGDRVRVTAPLVFPGCTTTYTLQPGPILDLGAAMGGSANALDVDDPANHVAFELSPTLTITFGGAGLETFDDVGADASFIPGQTNWSSSRWLLYPSTTPKMKGFVRFDFLPALLDECGVTSAEQILEAKFSALPYLGHKTTLELRRCLMPWGEPPMDSCPFCPGAVTVNHSTHPTIAWHQTGARAVGGSGTSPSEYYPTGSFDVAAVVDAVAAVIGLNERVEFAGPLVTDAFRFWFDHPELNFGYAVEVQGTTGPGIEFWNSGAEGGRNGLVLTLKLALPPNSGDMTLCNCDGDLDLDGDVDLGDLGALLAAFGESNAGDLDDDGDTDLGDLGIVLSNFGTNCMQ